MPDSVYDRLLSRLGEASPQPRLSAMRRVMELMGDPQSSAPVIHITGTNGKSSVSRMVEALVRAHGLKTGLFVSPHLESFNERIVVDGIAVTDDELNLAWESVEPILSLVDAELREIGEPVVTFFEAITVLAFTVFADAPVDVMILEVGMGGAWDATNVADATVAVFTPIDLDHTKHLGSTVAKIARTKAGIMKHNAVVVSAAQSAEVAQVLRESAKALGLSFWTANENFSIVSSVSAVGGQVVSIRGLYADYPDLALPLYGLHQAENLALAIAVTEAFLADAKPLSLPIVEDGVSEVTSPGRFERVSQSPLIFVDSGHNPHGISALVDTVSTTFPGRECAIVIGVLLDKDAGGILEKLCDLSDTFFVTQPSSERALPASQLAQRLISIGRGTDVHEFADAADAIEAARVWASSSDERIVVVTGSILLVGEALTHARDWKWSKQ